MPPIGQGLDWSLEGPENYFCSGPNTVVISQSYKKGIHVPTKMQDTYSKHQAAKYYQIGSRTFSGRST